MKPSSGRTTTESVMAIYNEEQLLEVSKHFQIYGQILHAEPCKIGHINETYTATYDQAGVKVRYIHQKINQGVFKNPDAVMDNIMRVTGHIREKLTGQPELTRRVLTVVPTRDGRSYHRNGAGDVWRSFFFIEQTQTFEAVQTTEQATEAGKAFGRFQQLVSDLPGRLVDTIPDFHHTRKRFLALQKAIQSDHCNRAKQAQAEIAFALSHENIVDVLLNAQARGEIPERVTHNDTKFNNVMLDTQSGEAMCVVDLDTVMPGLALYDFGDMVRTTTSPTMEDERDLSKVRMELPMFEALARGYWSQAGAFLNLVEKGFLPFAGKLITFNIGIRFLTDYLDGDHYFRVHRPGHNLDRCRTQFKLIESIEQQESILEKFVASL